MQYKTLGRTGVKVSPLCLGAMMFGGEADAATAAEVVARALDAGINFIDTANAYHRGRSEEVLGGILAADGRRSKIVLATKVFNRMSDDPNDAGLSRRHVIEQCEASLRRLRTDYIDLYQLHRPSLTVPIDETLRALDDLVRAGKVRYLGTSTFAAWQIVEGLWASKDYGLNRFVCEQPPYNILDRRVEREVLPMAATFGLGVIPWGPLAGGLLTGKYRRGEPAPVGTRYGDLAPGDFRLKRYVGAAFDVVDALAPLARAKGCTLSQFALAWVAQQPHVSSAIIGPRRVDQLVDNLGALQVKIDDEDRRAVDAVVPPGEVVVSHYNTEPGPHRHRI
ncbi:MAG: aldo/keto reductase [Gammaproteobacteria bacterium]